MNEAAHARHHDDLYAYVLGALSEAEPLERHLLDCAECRRELERLRPAVDALGEAVEQVSPPPGLKRSLLDAVKEEAATSSDGAVDRGRPGVLGRLARSGRTRRLGARRLAPALAALAVGLLGGFGLGTLASRDFTDTVAVQVSRGGPPNAEGTLTLIDDGKDGAVLRVSGVPTLGPGRTYQAWLERDGEISPQATAGVAPDGRAVAALTDDLSGASAVLVTREPAGGSSVPSEQPILRADLPSG